MLLSLRPLLALCCCALIALPAAAQDAPKRRRQMPGGAAAPFFSFPNDALPYAPQPGIGTPGAPAGAMAGEAGAADKYQVALEARFAEKGKPIDIGMHWRVFPDKPEANGQFALIAESRDATPTFALRNGGYIVHAAFGLVEITKRIEVGSQPMQESFLLPAGAIRFAGAVGPKPIQPTQLSFDIYSGSMFDSNAEQKLVRRQVPAGELVMLREGAYNVVSVYGDANATIRADVKIAAGKLTDTTIHHRAATVGLKLVPQAGGTPLGNTAWTVLTPGGDVIKESIGAFPAIVLAEGDYLAIARYDGRIFNRKFAVEAGKDLTLELLAK